MKPNLRALASRAVMGAAFLSLTGAGVLMVDSSLAQSTISGSWNTNGGGSWGTLGNWSYGQPMRPTAVSVVMNQGPLITVVRQNDKLFAIELQNVVGAGGAGYTKAPTVIISDPGPNGRPAIARANLDIDDGVQPGDVGAITSFTVLDPGSGYTGTITATVSREISGLLVTDAGSGYAKAPLIEFSGGGGYASNSPPTVSFRGGLGDGADATAVVTGGQVTDIVINNRGGGYSIFKPPAISFVTTVSGSGAAATVALGVSAETFIIDGGTTTYSVPPTVTISSPTGPNGENATATANLDGNGRVTGITVTNPGKSFTGLPPTITFSGGTVLVAGINPTGVATERNYVIGGITRTSNGSGYSNQVENAPAIVFSKPAPDNVAQGTAIVEDGRVIAVEINDGGINYTTPPQVIFAGGTGVTGNGGVYATASISGGEVSSVTVSAPYAGLPAGGGAGGAVATTSFSPDPEVAKFGAVNSITLNNSGQGYTAVPSVAIGATLRRTATATSVITGGAVTAVNIGNHGSGYIATPGVSFSTARWLGYTSAPRIRFVSGGVTGAVATATRASDGTISAMSVADGGGGYTVAPTVTIVGGNGTGAAITATVSGGAVTGLTVTNQGSSYGVAPTLVFSGGGGSGAKATANLAGGRIVSVTLTSPGTGYTSAPVVSIIPGDVADPARATAVISGGRVTGLNISHNGSGYSSVPSVVFTSGGVTFATATATVSAGRLSRITLTYPGSGYTTAPALNFSGGLITGGTQASAVATVADGRLNDAFTITAPGGADPASATAVMAPNGTVDSINVVSGGNGYLSAPGVTIGDPTGVTTPVMLAPGGQGSFVQFNRDIGGNITVTLEDGRVVGSLSIGDTGGEDYVLNSGTGGTDSSLSFSMGAIGGGKSFLNKLQGDQDVINAPITLTDELNMRINSGRLTLNGGITGTGDLVLTGNSVLTIRGTAPTSNLTDLWLWNRGTTNTGAQIELGATGGPSFQNIRLGNASAGTAGHAVLQLLEGRGAGLADPTPFYDQISDTARIIVDGVTNRWGYFKLMGADETIGSILDVGNALVLENMEGETINTDAVLTLGGDNLDSYIGGFIRNRSGGSGSGTLGLTKNGTGSLTLSGGNINYTGDTLLNAGSLRLINTSNFNSRIVAASGVLIEVETTTAINFDNDVVGDAQFRKLGNSSISFNSGQMGLDNFFMTAGSANFRAGPSTLRGGENMIEKGLTVLGDNGADKNIRISDSLSVGFVQAEGRFGQTGSFFNIYGERLSSNNRGYYRDGVLESAGAIEVTNMMLRMIPSVVTDTRVVTANTYSPSSPNGSTNVVLNDVNNLILGSVMALTLTDSFDVNTRNIPNNTTIVAINPVTRTVTLSNTVKIISGTNVTFNFSSQTDGAIRGESLNFADVVHDGRKFVAVTSKGTIHTSLNGTTWTQVYEDILGQPFESLTWTGERYVAVGALGRVVTSGAGVNWVSQSSGISTTLHGVTGTEVSFTGNIVAGQSLVTNVSNATTFLPGMTVVGNATAPDTRIVSASVAGSNATIVIDSPALAAGTDVEFTYFKGTTNTTTATASTINNVRTAQHVPTGIELTSSQPNGIPAGTTVLEVNGPQSKILMSQNANTSSVGGVDLFTMKGDLTAGSDMITSMSNVSGLAVGMTIKGAGVPLGARVTAIDAGAGTVTLDVKVPITRSATPLSIFTGRLQSGSAEVVDVTSVTSINVGMTARGRLLPANTKVLASTADSITLTNPATGTVTGASLLAIKTVMTRTGDFSTGSDTVNNLSSTAGLVAGMPVSAPGVIPAGTTIQTVGATSITLTQQALSGPTGQSFNAGFDVVAVGDNGRIMASAGGTTNTWVSLPSLITRDLNAITWNGSRLVAVGDNSEVLYSDTGLSWTRQTPPLTASENVIISRDGTGNNRIIGLNNVVTAKSSSASFAAFKGVVNNVDPVLPVTTSSVSGITGIHILRPKLQIFAPLGLQVGVTVSSVNTINNSAVLSSPATSTVVQSPIQTFTALASTRVVSLTGVSISAATDIATKVGHGLFTGDSVTLTTITNGAGLKPGSVYYVIRLDDNNFKLAISPADAEFGNAINVSSNRTSVVVTPNPNILKEVSDFKGLMPGMLLHGSGLAVPTAIIAMDKAARTITLASATTSSGRLGFGVLYGDLTEGSTTVTNISVFPSIQAMSGRTNHLTVGKAVGPFPDRVPNGATISAFNSGANTITLSLPAIGTGYVPLYTLTGTTSNGSNVITDVADASFNGLAVNQQIYVTGSADPTDTFSVFTILALDRANGDIVLSGPPSLNETGSPTVAYLGVFTGLVTTGENVVRNLSNRLGVPPPTLFQPDLQDVVWTGSQFITVGGYGSVLTSSNGASWLPQDSGTGNDLYTVGRSGSQFLAAGEDGLILKSTNGSAWSVARAADDPAILDVRMVRDIQALVSTSSQTLALGSGGLASADGNNWGTGSVANTFSGTQTFLTIAGRPGGGGGLTLVNEVITSQNTSPVGQGILLNTNNTNRIDDGITLQSRGGTMLFENNAAAGVNFSETIGKLLLTEGHLQLQTFQAGNGGTSTLTFGSLEAKPGAYLELSSRDRSSGSAQTVIGSIGSGARNRVVFTQKPVLDDGIIGGFVTIDNEWATYNEDAVSGISGANNEFGVIRLPETSYEKGDQPNWTATDNVWLSSGRTLTTPVGSNSATMIARAINSLKLVGQTLNLDGRRLSIESGGILVTGNTTIQGNSANGIAGVITRGSARDTEAVMNIINPAQLTLNTQIVDFSTVATVGAHPIGATVITLTPAGVIGLLVGMEVTGGGAAIPPGTRIVKIDTTTSPSAPTITLSVPLAEAIGASTVLSFTGGPVSLAKSGTGLLILGLQPVSNTYSGKTYLNNGITRILNFDALGSAPASFVQDQIQLNGGTLQFNHTLTGQTVEPDYNLNLNDNRRGLTIGIAGGRLEVGVSNPDNANTSTKVPQINVTISNPINAIGVLELAVRSSPSLLPRQTNTITLGTLSSTNTYRAGIKTEALFGGTIFVRGNNEIGGIFLEDGEFFLDGNNNFTSSIRALNGNITINGNNTWKGSSTWGDPVEFRSGRLTLRTPGALGTGGLNLIMGDAAELVLAGVSQTIRQFTSVAGSIISNRSAPDGIVGATPVVFDMDRNQTYAGTLMDGTTISGNQIATLKLVKQGPGTLTLTNRNSLFSGGIEILEGALNVTSISDVNSSSAIGMANSNDPALLLIDKSVFSITPVSPQSSDRSFTMGSGPYGATIAANGGTQQASVTLGLELRDAISGTTSISSPVAFLGTDVRTLTLSGLGRGDNKFLLELGDSSAAGVTSLFKASTGTWVLGKSNTYSGLTTVHDGLLVVTQNDALGTKGRDAIINQMAGTFTSDINLPNGTPVTFPLFAATNLPGGVKADTQYYVVGSSGNTFQISTTPNGTPVALTSSGANVKFVPKLDAVRSTSVDMSTNQSKSVFTGQVPNGSVITFNTKLGPTAVTLPTGLLTNTPYYVVNSENGTFEVSDTPGGTPIDFSGTSTPDSLYYTNNAVGNAGAGVNLVNGTMELRGVDYITPEQLIFEGGFVSVPGSSTSSWAGDLMVNANARITVGANSTLTLNGNILGARSLNQEGEGTVIMRGETIAAATNVANSLREYAVRAGTLVLDYGLNNSSKLVDNAALRLGGSRRGGTVVLSGGSHEEIVGQLILEPGASKIFREQNSSSTLSFNNINRSTGSSLYVDGGRIAKADNINLNGIMGAWALIRDAITNAFWVIPGTSTFTYPVVVNASNDQFSTSVSHVVRNGMVATFSSTGTLPGGLVAGAPYYVVNASGFGLNLKVSNTLGGTPVNITSAGTGTLTLTAQLGVQPNANTDAFTTVDGHGLANGVKVHVSSYGQLPAGLSDGTDYYVVSSENRSFRLSLSIDGPAVNFTNNGTGPMVVETQGSERRAGPAALTFAINPDFAPAADGNNRVKVLIQQSGAPGAISATLSGQGTPADPYIYTITTTTSSNSNQQIASFVANHEIGSLRISSFLTASTSSSSPLDFLYPQFTRFTDLSSFGAPTGVMLANGTYDNGSVELDWARNAGIAGSSTTLNDGFIMPSSSYTMAWGSTINTGITGDLSVGNPGSTFSVRFANQVGSTVNLLNSGLYPIRTGGVLVSPTVGANDSTFTGSGVLTTENQGNLQNLLLHQYNQAGSLIINNKITNRQAFSRSARLTGQSRRYLTMNVSLAGTQVAPGWTLPVTTGVNAGISADTRIESITQNRLVILSSNHNGAQLTAQFSQNYVFASPGAVVVNADQDVPVGHPSRTQITSLSTTADITVGMVVTGPGIVTSTDPDSQTKVAAIINGKTVQLDREISPTFQAGAYTFTAGVTTINRPGVINDPNHFLITGLSSVTGLTVGMTVTGTGIAPNTVIAEVSPSQSYVRLNNIHDGVYQTGVSFTFDGNIVRTGTLPIVVAVPGSPHDPNRRILDGVTTTTNLLPGMSVEGLGLQPGTTVDLILGPHTIYLNQPHDGQFRRGNYTFRGGSLPPITGQVYAASVPSADRRIVMGVIVPAAGNNASAVSTHDLYIGMPISGPGIPFGSTITFIYNESDIQVSTNHFFTAENTTLTFTPTTGVEKLGPGLVTLTGASDYTGVTFIADGTLRANLLTDGGVPGSLGASNGGSGNLVFNGGTLQYVGENGQTNRGFTVADFATLNIGHERTTANFSGVITSGADSLNKSGPGTLELNGSANLAAMRVEQGRLLLQTVDTNPSPGTFSPSNFSQSALTSLFLGGGTLELRGTPEGSVTQNFGSQLTIEAGSTTVKVTGVPVNDPASLITLSTRLNIMGQEEITPVVRNAGGTVHFLENPVGRSSADIFLYLPVEERQTILPWATYQDTTNVLRPGVNHFATVLQATSDNQNSGGEVVSAGLIGYRGGSGLLDPMNWESMRSGTADLNVTESALDSQGQPLAINGNVTDHRYVRTLRFVTAVDGTVNIAQGISLELVGGAILAGTDIFGGHKAINGLGTITGGALNSTNSDLIMHNYNPITPFTLGASIVDRTVLSANEGRNVGKGEIKAGEVQMKIKRTGTTPENRLAADFFLRVRVGMRVSGPGIQPGTLVEEVESDFSRIILSLPATETHVDEIYTFTDTTNFVQSGTGTTILAGNNTYTGKTFVNGGVLRLDSANAIPGGIGTTGGTSSIVVEDAVIGLGAGDFSRKLGTGISEIFFSGNGGFAAYGADRTVNLGGSAVPETLRFGNNGFVPDGASLILGSRDATHKLIFANPIDLSAFSQAIRVENSVIDVEAELAGSLSGLGRMIKFGLGTLRLGVSNTNQGGIEIAEGRLVAANVANVFGTPSGLVRLGTSTTNTLPQSALELVVEGGSVANPVLVGSVNSRGALWTKGGTVESSQNDPVVGEESSAAVVSGYPAVAYYDSTNQDLKYVRALDARGQSWGTPVTVYAKGNVGRNPSLQIINGNPAISYYDTTTGMLMYVRSTDAQGVVWGTPLAVIQSAPTAVAVQPADGKIIVGGSFTQFDGQTRYRLVRLMPSAVSGESSTFVLDPTFNAFIMNGEVRSIMVLPDGRILVGGTFTAARENDSAPTDTTRNRIAVFTTTGALDMNVDPNANGDVRTFVRQTDGKIMVCGSFTTVSGVSRMRLARLNANVTLDTSFGNPDIRNGEVRAVIPEDTNPGNAGFESYAIAGTFTDIRGSGRNRLARINSDATLASTFNPDANNNVLDMVRLPTGRFLVGGSFTAFTGGAIARTRLARLNSDGSVDETFSQEVNGEVRDLHLETNGDVLVAGVFSQLGDATRNFIGRVLANGGIDPVFMPEPDNEVRQIASMADGKIVMAGLFNAVNSTTQQMVARTLATGAQDVGFSRFIINAGLYSSLCSVNGNPAIAYYDTKGGDIYYIRSTDANGGVWPNPERIDSTGNVGVGISLAVGNIGGDLLTKDNRNTATTADDEVTLSGSVATNGTPIIAYGDATNQKIKYVVANNVNGSGNTGFGLGESMTNWSTPEDIPGLGGQVGRHFMLSLVDGFPAITYQTSNTKDLMYIRALNPAGMTHNLRDNVTSEILRILVTELSFETATSWGAPVVLDGNAADDLGSFPSLALINGQPTTEKNRPAVSYYDATRGDLKYVTSSDSTGAVWNAPTTVVSMGDVGRSNTLLVADGLPASVYFNATTNDLDFVILNNASGYSRIAMNDNTTWSGNMTLNGMATLAPAVGTVSQLTGLITGASGFRLAGGGTLSIAPNQRQLLMTSIAGLSAGWSVSGLGIPAGAVIASIDSLNSVITLDRDHDNVSRTGTYTFSFSDQQDKQYVGTVLVGNSFASDLRAPGETTGPGNEVNGGVVIRSGTLLFNGVNALSSATVELGDQVSGVIATTRATNSISVLSQGGYFNPNHDGISVNLFGPGAFVDIGATIDGHYYGLFATTADANADRFTGNLTNGTAVRFRAEILPTDVLNDTTYYVRDSNGTSFKIAATANGPAVDFSNSDISRNVFYIEESSFTAQILVKDESANPERNGIYRVRITTDNLELKVNKINLVRVDAMDTVPEMAFGTRATVSGGTHQGQTYYISSLVSDRNVSAVHWVQEIVADVALLASSSGVTLSNAIDVNRMGGGISTILGANSGVTSGNVLFSGPITLQNRAVGEQDAQVLQVLSSTSTGLGVRFTGAITESSAEDRLSLMKSGSGVVTLEGNSSFKGGIVINQGALYVMNNPATAQPGQSGTGSGAVTVNAGTLLSGVGSIGGPVTLTGTTGSLATLRPGDPLSSSAATETLTINAPLVVGADSVVEFTVGVNNITRLVGTSMSLSTTTSKIVVALADGYNPANGTVIDILDLNSPLSVFGGAQNLLNLLLLPTSKAWDTSEFISKGIIKVIGDPIPLAITTHPADVTKQQGESHTFNVVFTGSGPVTAQWQKSKTASAPFVWEDIPGATGTSLTLSNLTDANDEARYRVRLTNPGSAATGGIFSNSALLVVNWQLSFAQDLSTTRVAAVNSPLILSVVMNGEDPITYEWLKDGVSLGSLYTGNTLTIPSVRPLGGDGKYPDAGSYQVRVKGKFQATGILSKVCKVTITETDAVVVEMPQSQTVLAGTTVTLSGVAGGLSTGRALSWRRGGSVILGEVTDTLILPNMTVAQGGDYYFGVTNIVGGKTKVATSEPAYVVVVDNSTRIVAGQVTKSVKLTALVGTPSKVKPIYQWLKDGQPLPASPIKDKFKAATNSLTINKLTEEDAGTYTCRVTGAPGTAAVVGATHYVQIFTQAPEFVKTTPPPTGMVGHSYSWKIPTVSDVAPTMGDPSPDAWLKTPATYAVVSKGKLPAGLKLDAATGLITGRPTAATDAVSKLITFSLRNGASPTVVTWETELVILPLPQGIEGTFAGPIERSSMFNAGLGGRFDMQVARTGTFTGKIILGVEAARSFAGAFSLNYDNAGNLLAPPSVTLTIPGTKTAVPVTISFSLNISGAPAATRITAASISYRTDSVSFSGWRNSFSTTNPATLYQDLYNTAITLPHGSDNIGNVNVPQGNGYATFKVAVDGRYTFTGRTADNEALTGAYFVGPAGEAFIFQTLYASTPKGSVPARGSLLGNMTIVRNGGTNSDDNSVTGTLDWVRPPNSKSRLYKDGFGLTGTPVTSPVSLAVYGSRFILKDRKTDSVFGMPTTTGTVEFSEDRDYLPANGDVVSAVNPNSIGNVSIGLGSTVFIPDATTPTKKSAVTTVSINHATGLVTGSFNLVDTVAGKPLKRKATIMGLIVRKRIDINSSITTGTGFFILDQLPGGSTSPQRSGIFKIER